MASIYDLKMLMMSTTIQVVRLYKGYPVAEFEYTVGPIPIR